MLNTNQANPTHQVRFSRLSLILVISSIAVASVAAAYAVAHKQIVHVLVRAGIIAAAAPQRAAIVDRNGVLLAKSMMEPSLYADPSRVTDPARVANILAGILPNIDVQQLTDTLSSHRRFLWIARHVTPSQRASVDRLGISGLGFRWEEGRV